MSYECRFLHIQSNECVLPTITIVETGRDFKVDGTRRHDLLIRTRGCEFYPADAPLQPAHGDVITAWYVDRPPEGIPTENTYLTIYAFNRTEDRFIWPSTFASVDRHPVQANPAVVVTTGQSVSVELDEDLEELARTKPLGGSYLGTVTIRVVFEDLAIVACSGSCTREGRMLKVSGNCIVVAIYSEQSYTQGREAPLRKSTIPKHEWPMRTLRKKTAVRQPSRGHGRRPGGGAPRQQ